MRREKVMLTLMLLGFLLPAQAQFSADWGRDLFGEQLPNGIGIDTAYGFYTYTTTGDSLFMDAFAETRAVSADGNKNSVDVSDYLGGYYEAPAFNYVNWPQLGAIINKRSAQGNLLWTRYLRGAQHTIAWSVTHDASDNIITCGFYRDSLDVDPDPGVDNIIQSSAGLGKNGFIVKLNPAGNLIYGLNIRSSGDLTCYDIGLDAAGNMLIVGDFEGTADFDPGVGVVNETATGNAENLFVLKLDANGNYLWHHVSQTSHFSRAYKCAVDNAGAVYVTGEFSNQVDFSGSGLDVRSGAGSFDAFIFKLDHLGNYQWARNYGSTDLENIRAIHFHDNHLWVAGVVVNSLNIDPGVSNFTVSTGLAFSSYVQKLDPAGGHVWAAIPGDGQVRIRDIDSDKLGSTVFTGHITSPTIFNLPSGPQTLTNQARDFLVFAIDSTNATSWAQSWESPDNDWGNGLAVVNSQEIVIAGTFEGQLFLNPPGNDLVLAEGSGYEGLTYKISKCTVANSLSITACESFTSPSGRTTWTQSGNYADTIFVSGDCDTIIAIDLTIFNADSSTETISACDSYLSPSGNLYTASGVYIDTLTNSLGCDRIVTLNLTINTSSQDSIAVNACGSYTVPSGSQTYFQSGVYQDTLTTSNGCDSLLIIDLNINQAPDTAVINNGDSLVAVATGVNYQWLDCNQGFQAISGATNASFVPAQSGSYALAVESNGCVDTSSCQTIVIVGLEELYEASIKVFPNPVVDGFVKVELPQDMEAELMLFDPLGRVIWSGMARGRQRVELPEASGVYLLSVRLSNTRLKTFRLIRGR